MTALLGIRINRHSFRLSFAAFSNFLIASSSPTTVALQTSLPSGNTSKASYTRVIFPFVTNQTGLTLAGRCVGGYNVALRAAFLSRKLF